MKKFKVPYSIIVQGELECKAETPAQANIHARRWIRDQGIDVHKTLMEMGAGTIRVHSNEIAEIKQEPEEKGHTWKGGKFE